MIGDSTFFHSGMTSLLNVLYNQSNVTVIILDNRITAMTGAQENPGTGKTLQNQETNAVDVMALVKALGADRVRQIDPFDLDGTLEALKEEAAYPGPSVLVTKRPCIQLTRQDPSLIRRVDGEACIGCGMCLNLGCPAISQGDVIESAKGGKARRRAVIDASLCRGCALCDQVCKPGAVKIGA